MKCRALSYIGRHQLPVASEAAAASGTQAAGSGLQRRRLVQQDIEVVLDSYCETTDLFIILAYYTSGDTCAGSFNMYGQCTFEVYVPAYAALTVPLNGVEMEAFSITTYGTGVPGQDTGAHTGNAMGEDCAPGAPDCYPWHTVRYARGACSTFSSW